MIDRPHAFDETAQKIGISLGRDARNEDGTVLTASAAAGKFGITSGNWTTGGLKLVGEAASNNSKTSTVKYRVALPQNYVAGSEITLHVNANVTATPTVSGVIDASAFESNTTGGVVGTDIQGTAVQSLTTSMTDFKFVIDGSGLNPGDELEVYVQTVVNDTGGATGAIAQIGNIWLETTTRM